MTNFGRAFLTRYARRSYAVGGSVAAAEVSAGVGTSVERPLAYRSDRSAAAHEPREARLAFAIAGTGDRDGFEENDPPLPRCPT